MVRAKLNAVPDISLYFSPSIPNVAGNVAARPIPMSVVPIMVIAALSAVKRQMIPATAIAILVSTIALLEAFLEIPIREALLIASPTGMKIDATSAIFPT